MSSTSRIQRSPIKIAMVVLGYLAAGAVVNVAVAWGIAIWVPLPDQSDYRFSAEAPASLHMVPADWPVLTEAASARSRGHSVTQARFEMPGGVGTYRIFHQQNGWPCNSVELWFLSQTAGPPPKQPAIEQGYRIPLWFTRFAPLNTPYASRLALRPDMPGFVVNMFVYGGVVFVLSLLVEHARRSLRLRRGMCPVCKYPIGVSANCTECGHELPRWMIQKRVPVDKQANGETA